MLKLTIQKGPLSGRVIDVKPGSRFQIGRVIRGNTLAIKDAGISSKHLAIQFESGSGQWTVTDLGSSNGTVLNNTEQRLSPSTPYALSDGDVIKIGELTAIEVKVEVEVKEEEDSRPRRNPRRRPAAEAGKLGVIDENSELGLGFGEELGEENNGKVGGRRGRVSKNEVREGGGGGEELENLGGNEVKEENKVVSTRRTRSSKRGGGDLEDQEEAENVVVAKVSSRRTRRSKQQKDLENGDGMGNVVVGRRTRGAKKEEKVENGVEDGEETENLGVVEEEKGRRMNLRRMRSSTKEENLGGNWSKGGEVGNLDVVEGRRTRKGTRGTKNLPIEPSESVENTEMREEEMVEKLNLGEGCEGEEGNLEGDGADGKEEKEDVNLGREDGDGLAGTSGVKESGVQVDLEKMTLGEWFDYLEEYLPKQIIDQTEEMILGMRQKAEKFHEFMLQQKAPKEKDEVPIG